MKSDVTLFLSLVTLRYLIAILMFGDAYAPLHDNLDSVVVYNVVAGNFWASGFDASVFDVFIAGQSKWFHYYQSLSPQTLFYALFSPQTAYVANEVLGLALAFFSTALLLRTLEVSPWPARVFAALFAFSVAYSTYGLGYSAAPLLIWLSLRPQPPRLFEWSVVALIGASTSLALHGFFFPFALLASLWLFGQWSHTRRAFAVAMLFLAVSVLASSGVIYSALFEPPSHRVDFLEALTPPTLADVVTGVLAQFAILSGQGHAIVLPGLFAAPFLAAMFLSGSNVMRDMGVKLAVLIFVVGLISVYEAQILALVPGFLKSIQIARFGLYLPLLLILSAALTWTASPSRGARRTISIAAGIYGILATLAMSGLNPSSLKSAIPERMHDTVVADLKAKGVAALVDPSFYRTHGLTFTAIRAGGETFSNHFRPEAYACVRTAVKGGRVLSIGLDPMVAPFHGIAAIDGYHNFYPLTYKTAFRDIIADQLPVSRKGASYFDDWGSRLESFVTQPDVFHLNLNAARALGATALISAFPIDDILEIPLPCGSQDPVFVYQLAAK